MNEPGKFRQGLVLLVVFLVMYFGLPWVLDRNLASGVPPSFRAAGLDGSMYEGPKPLGKPQIVYFWASWCGVCRAMQDNVRAVARDVPVLAVAMQSGDAGEVKRYMEEAGFDVPAVLDEDGEIGKSYGIRGVPALFVLGPEGEIRHASVGYASEWGIRARLWLAGQ